MIVVLTQCFPPAIGGIENLMGGAARSLASRGHKVVVLADGHKGRVTESADLGEVRYFGGWKVWRRWRKTRALERLLTDTPADAVLTDSWKSVETLIRSGRVQNAGRVICYAHGNEFPEQPSESKIRRIVRVMAHVTKLIANSRFTAERAEWYIPAERIVVRAPPVEAITIPSPDEQAWAEGLWEGATPRLLSLSRLEPLKGIDFTIFALTALVERYPSLRYVIAGAGGDLDRLKTIVAENKLDEHVVFAGPVVGTRKSALYKGADLFVMPTRRVGQRQEAFGMVYLEAALHGLPAIGGRAGGAEEAILHGQTGLLIDGADVSDITAAIDHLLSDEAARCTMARAAAAFSQRFTWPVQIEVLEDDLVGSAA